MSCPASDYEQGSDLLTQQVELCALDLGLLLDEAVHRWGGRVLGQIELPRLESPIWLSPGELRAVAVLYWCMETEAAGLPRFVEALADALFTGRLHIDISPMAAAQLAHYRAQAHTRHTAAERRFRFSSLFGGPGSPRPNERFPAAWAAFVESLASIAARPQVTPGDQARLATLAQVLLAALSNRMAGATRYDADRFLFHVREVLELLREPGLRDALGGGPPLALIAWHAPVVLGEVLDPVPHIGRAVAGATLLRWLSENLEAVQRGALSPSGADGVSSAASQLVV